MEKTFERLNAFINSTGMTKNKFADYIGTSSALISKLTTQDIDFRIDILDKILTKYPTLNVTWLLHGVGAVYNGNGKGLSEKETYTNIAQTLIEHKGETLSALNSEYVDETISSSKSRIIQLKRSGKIKYLDTFSTQIKKEHPEYLKHSDDLALITEVERLIESLHDSALLYPIYAGINNLMHAETYKEFKGIWLDAYSKSYKHQSITHDFAVAAKKFILEIRKIQHDIDLNYNFEYFEA